MFKKLLLIYVFFFAFSVKVNALTLTQIYTEVRRNINDNPSDSARYRYSDAVLLDFVNTAQREIVNATWLSEKTTSYQLSANTTFYSLPNDLLAVMKVEFTDSGGGIIELRETSLKKLFNDNVEWRTDTGSPVDYYVSQANISSPSLSALNISYIPVPINTSTGTVAIQYFNRVPDLSAGSDVAFSSKSHLIPYHQTIVYNVTAKIKLIEMKSAEAQFYFQLYTNDLGLMRDRINSMPNYSPSMQIQGRP